MIQVFKLPIVDGHADMTSATQRFGLIHRTADACRKRDIDLMAFGIGDDHVRLVIEGPERLASLAIRGVKSGTHRAAHNRGIALVWGDTHHEEAPLDQLEAWVAWCHSARRGSDPLASPWTSHRDLMGLRCATFFDARPVTFRVNVARVHAMCGGGPLPAEQNTSEKVSLDSLLKTAASVIGVLPSNRACFRLFVHLARLHGWHNRDLADALMLSQRRIRQLAGSEEPLLRLAQVHLADPRLAA